MKNIKTKLIKISSTVIGLVLIFFIVVGILKIAADLVGVFL